MSDEDKGYKIKDRRAFTPEGELREDQTEALKDAPEAPSSAPAPAAAPAPETRAASSFPEIDFTTFLLSLASNALMQMGATGEGTAGGGEVDLRLARQTIDIISMLQQKTRGNLTGEEERLLDHILYDLRIQFVAATKRR
jgi:hypothetical protein